MFAFLFRVNYSYKMKPGESLRTIILETQDEIEVARDASDARSDASKKLSEKLRDASAPIELEQGESQFVLHSLRFVRDLPIFREIEADATKMLNDYADGHINMSGTNPALPELDSTVRPYSKI